MSDDIRQILREELQPMIQQVNRHDHWINGNGVPGAKSRLARIEQVMKWMSGAMYIIALSFASLIVMAIVKFL